MAIPKSFVADTGIPKTFTPDSQPVQEKGFFGRVKEAILGRSEQLNKISDRSTSGQQSALESVGQVAGTAIGAAGDVAFEGVRALTPKYIRELIGSGIESLVSTEPVQKTVNAYKTWADANPRASADIEAGFNILSVLPVGKAANKVVGSVSEKAPKLSSFFEGRLANQQIDDTLRVIKPELNKAEKVRLLSQGQAEEGWFGAIKSLPTDKDFEVAETVKDIVSPRKSPIANIQAINNELAIVGKSTDEGLKGIGLPYSNKQLAAKLNDAKDNSRVVFGSEKSIENTYDAVTQEFMRIKSKYPNTVSGLRDARVEFDGVMKQKFPKVFENPAGTDVARYNAINDVRRSVNDYTVELLPEGNPYKQQLKQMSNLYSAQKNIAVKAAKNLDVNNLQKLRKFISENPLLSVAGLGGITAGAITGILTSPLLISGLLLGGTYKAGKSIMTSQTLKKALINILNGAKNLDDINQNTIRQIITEIDSYNGLTEKSKTLPDIPNKQGGFIKTGASQADNISTDLLQEAKKYKTAEEFVKAQGDSFYHTTPVKFDKFDKKYLGTNTEFDNTRSGFFFTDNLDQIQEFKDKLQKGFGGNFIDDGLKKTPEEIANYRTIEKIAKKENFFNFNYKAKDLTPKEARDFAEFANKKMGGLYDLDGNEVNYKKMTDSELNKFLKDNVFIEDLDPDSSFLPQFTEQYLEDFNKFLEKKGYKGMISDYGAGKNEYLIFDPNILPTKSQLTDIWNKANKK